jgi:hypothetical protein
VPGLDIGKTQPKRPAASGPEESHTVPKDQYVAQGADNEVTRPVFVARIGIDPVVGWLVCIAGPERGSDYRIHAENNSIGRSETMDICIAADQRISREHHATISYDPETNKYTLLPGSARGLTHHNRQPVYGPVELRPFDEIKMGESSLLFVPFLGDFGAPNFRWA